MAQYRLSVLSAFQAIIPQCYTKLSLTPICTPVSKCGRWNLPAKQVLVLPKKNNVLVGFSRSPPDTVVDSLFIWCQDRGVAHLVLQSAILKKTRSPFVTHWMKNVAVCCLITPQSRQNTTSTFFTESAKSSAIFFVYEPLPLTIAGGLVPTPIHHHHHPGNTSPAEHSSTVYDMVHNTYQHCTAAWTLYTYILSV